MIKQDSPDVGVMETDWAESRAKLPEEGIRGLLTKTLSFLYSTSELDKFRARVEKSAEDGMIEVHISHRGDGRSRGRSDQCAGSRARWMRISKPR